ncbi:hypothetical protein ILUMI_27411 [Ignelater luminosus]|uniref:Transposase n=1 Tax=Ignelater luminosus TaxID=2038154 RepID=A0A8K0FVN1_IGNLU|nr:hypothetical protein ILUMI_27411 [Ignelater luminosus]
MAKFVKQIETCTQIVNKYLENPELSQVQIAKLLKLPRSTVGKAIRTYKERLSTERKPGSGRKTGFQDTNLAVRIKQSYRRNPNLSERTVGNKFGTSKATVHRVKVKAGLKTYKIQEVPDRDQEKERRARGWLSKKMPLLRREFSTMTGEGKQREIKTVIDVEFKYNNSKQDIA